MKLKRPSFNHQIVHIPIHEIPSGLLTESHLVLCPMIALQLQNAAVKRHDKIESEMKAGPTPNMLPLGRQNSTAAQAVMAEFRF